MLIRTKKMISWLEWNQQLSDSEMTVRNGSVHSQHPWYLVFFWLVCHVIKHGRTMWAWLLLLPILVGRYVKLPVVFMLTSWSTWPATHGFPHINKFWISYLVGYSFFKMGKLSMPNFQHLWVVITAADYSYVLLIRWFSWRFLQVT